MVEDGVRQLAKERTAFVLLDLLDTFEQTNELAASSRRRRHFQTILKNLYFQL